MCVNNNLATISLFFRIYICYYHLGIRFMQAFWHTVKVNVAQRFCITGLGAQSSKPFLNHTPNGIPELWLAVLVLYAKGSDTRRELQNRSSPCPDSHHGYGGNPLFILEYAYLSLWHLVWFNWLWPMQNAEKQHNRRSETQHSGWKECNSVGSVSLILAILRNRCLV